MLIDLFNTIITAYHSITMHLAMYYWSVEQINLQKIPQRSKL